MQYAGTESALLGIADGVSPFCLPAGFELLYQPEVVRLYLSLLTESQNYNTLEAAAGALQNLSAGQWTVSHTHTHTHTQT